MSKLWTLISILVGVSVASALLGWMAFRLAKHMDSEKSIWLVLAYTEMSHGVALRLPETQKLRLLTSP